MAGDWAASVRPVRRKKGDWEGEIDGLVAEKEIMGIFAFSPRSPTNCASPEVCGPMIA